MKRTRIIPRFFLWFARQPRGRSRRACALGALLLLPLALAACFDSTPTPNGTPLNQLHWCGAHTLLFQSADQNPPTTLTDWKQVTSALDFTVYLPTTLPVGSCLVSGEALIHDKVLGSSFGATYLLPGGTSLAFSETAVSGQQAATFQCSPSTGAPIGGTPTPTPKAGGTPTPTPTPGAAASLLCLGSKGQTNIVIDSSAPENDLQTIFSGLQANVDWIPK